MRNLASIVTRNITISSDTSGSSYIHSPHVDEYQLSTDK